MPPKKERLTWKDDDDDETAPVPSFQLSATQEPSWAVSDARREKEAAKHGREDEEAEGTVSPMSHAKRKRYRSEDLESLLSKSEPLLTSRSNKQKALALVPLSVIPLPRDVPQTIEWHRNGQIVVVGGRRHFYTFYSAGGYTEQLSKTELTSRVEHAALCSSGEKVVIVGHETYTPQLLNLSTEQQTPLTFLDTRNTAIHRNGRPDQTKKDFFIKALSTPYRNVGSHNSSVLHSPQMVAVGSGSRVLLGNLASGSVTTTLSLDREVTAIEYTGAHELSVASGPRLYVYDVRKAARVLYSFTDEGSLGITQFSHTKSSIAIGSSNGIVNLYSKKEEEGGLWGSGGGGGATPVKVYKNLTTGITQVGFGMNSRGDVVLGFNAKGQKNGVRLAVLPAGNVLPSFPPVSSHHEFLQSMALAPTVPILSLGEKGKVTQYAL